MLRLLAGVTLLRGEPARERLAIVVKDHSGERLDLASNHDPMAVALVSIGGLILSIEHGARWIESAAQRPAADAVNETRRYPLVAASGRKPLQLRYELVAQFIVGVQ